MSLRTPTFSVRINRKKLEAVDVVSFELVNVNGSDLPRFSAGAHIDVSLGNGLTRQYSLCNSPDERNRYLIAVLNVPQSRGGSRFMSESLNEGEMLKIGLPPNQFPLVEAADHHLLIAGGIGITPILSMAFQLASLGASFELHYAARSTQRMAFAEEIRSGSLSTRTSLYLSDGQPSQKLDLPAILSSRASGTHVYVCGPGGLIDAAFDVARSAGWVEAQLHKESFSASIYEESEDQDFQIKLASTGKVIAVPKGTTVVEALADEGISLPTSCEQGICGTCLTGVLEGLPDHRDVFLSSEQHCLNDRFTPCCSRSKTAMLVLDL